MKGYPAKAGFSSTKANLKKLKRQNRIGDTSLYFRFYLEPKINLLPTRKTGINKSTIIYDFKVNELRNLPEDFEIEAEELKLCNVKTCFSFNILPNSYDLTFFDSSSLKNIRTLEFESFKKYLCDKRVKQDELVVVLNKEKGQDSYSFFSIFSKERISTDQIVLAVLVNLACAILLLIPTFREKHQTSFFQQNYGQVFLLKYIYLFLLDC